MKEYWERVEVTGTDGNRKHKEIVLCRRGENALVMAFRRNHALTACKEISSELVEAFVMDRKDMGKHVKRTEISRDNRQEEWDW